MTFTSTTTDTNYLTQDSPSDQAATAPSPTQNATLRNGLALGLLHDDQIGNQPVESKDITILRRLKLAILEGQHPYFKANVDLSNLQDLVLASGSRSIGPSAHQPNLLEPTLAQPSGHGRRNVPPALDDLRSSGPTVLDYGNEDSMSASEIGPEQSLQSGTTSARLEDVNMANLDGSEKSEQSGGNSQDGSSGDSSSEIRRPSTQTLGRYVLHSPIESEPGSQTTHKRKLSDTPTLVDSNEQTAESEVHVKCESPPYQLPGTQPQASDPSSSSMASFISTTSTELTSDGGTAESAPDADTDLAGYNPKYGNKADYLRRQKVRSKAIESIEDKNRRTGHRQDDKPGQKSPVRPMDYSARRGKGPSTSPARGRDLPSRTHTLTSISDLNGQGSSSRRTPSVDALPPPSFQTSPRGRRPGPSFGPISPTSGKYPVPRQSRDLSPTRDYRPQYHLPYDDPRSARPRPIVSSPPRGSPPHESPAPRTTIDNYSNSYPRTETRSFDLRPASPIFSEGPRTAGSYSMDSDSNWPAHGLPRAPHPPPSSRNSPPRDLIRDRTSFGSTTLPPNPNTSYRPQGLPDPPSTRYSPYDTQSRRVDWSSREWDSNRSADSKPKLQDRFTMDSSWTRDSIESRSLDNYPPHSLRDEFMLHPNDDYSSRYKREPSPPASRYADGFRRGFSRPPEVEGIRPMKRSRPDDGYAPLNASGSERSRYELDGRPSPGDYYGREPPRRVDEYEPRPRPPY
ncbi:unnamed protein product [Rhizoctonia solani]|uniref:Uncharacterized protein n=1 Tax=Rhizoctonia solani TaxID=456999 RepID=A0A8H2XUA9_9AGAM|nr:unnamed protein product [Rhizoctonia solani]